MWCCCFCPNPTNKQLLNEHELEHDGHIRRRNRHLHNDVKHSLTVTHNSLYSNNDDNDNDDGDDGDGDDDDNKTHKRTNERTNNTA